MLAKKKSVQKNFSNLVEEKNSADDSMTLQKDELKNFQAEIQRQIEAGNKIIDIGKAIRNAKYLTTLDRGFEDMKEGRGTRMTFEELENFINAECRV